MPRTKSTKTKTSKAAAKSKPPADPPEAEAAASDSGDESTPPNDPPTDPPEQQAPPEPPVGPTKGRPPGSATQKLESTVERVSVCVRPGCSLTEFKVIRTLPDCPGSWVIDGTERNVMKRQRVRCNCGQQRIRTRFMNISG